ncbi:MAG TPA: hypothetical protein VK668_01225 [Mucilaginibacter sp.]|nr:hypothetical protein [Mucilaginibacter sp.]
MRKKHTFYTLKVWLTTLLVSPFLLFILFVCIEQPNFQRVEILSLVSGYAMIILLTAVVSSVGWVIFWITEWLAYTYLDDIMKIKAVLFIGVQLIIISTFAGVLLYFGALTADSIMLYFLAPYCTVAGFSVWYYELEPDTEPPFDEMAEVKVV